MKFFAALAFAALPALGFVRPVLSQAQTGPVPGAYYLALGDSLAVGVTADGVPADPGCISPTAPGYVCVFYRYLQRLNPNLQLKNLAESGADSCVFAQGKGPGSPCADPLISGTAPSQVAEAVQFINQHPGQVTPISIDIGGNDLASVLLQGLSDPLGAIAKVPKTLTTIQTNLDSALQQLRAVDPNGEILVINQYNPIGGIGSPPLPSYALPAVSSTMDNLSKIDRQEAAKYGAVYVDVRTAFDKYPNGAASLTYVLSSALSGNLSKVNIHPTPQGYAVYAKTVIDASGYQAPLVLHARLASHSVRRGKTESITGSSVPFDALTLRIKRPRAVAQKVDSSVDEFGNLTLSFAVGKVPGRETARLCVSAPNGAAHCHKAMRLTVR
ncbi:MAG TPA: SGNH/GDSL hydrolase family protein [Chloroflexota bacterium]|nr:SGNH/GDSL hydrolase family protein [Chloroflexota bacterium]